MTRSLAHIVDRPVLDRTGLEGFYDFMRMAFAAVREQPGLEFEARKRPVEVFVIDHIERPTAN